MRLSFCSLCNGIDIAHASYQVTAIVYHLGDSILQGHYRAVLFEEGIPAYHTEDGRKAIRLRPRDLDNILNNAYLLFAVKSS